MIISDMYLVFDIGGSHIRVGTSLDKKNLTNSKIILLNPDFEAGIQILKQASDELGKGEKVQAVSGGIAGPLDKDKTMLIASSHIPNWVNKPLKETLQQTFNCPVYLENDSALGALGEANFGAGKGYKIVGYIAIGTGVGGAKVENGKLDENSLGFEPGHQIILPNGSPCNCGGIGHLETLVGGYYLERTYKQRGENIKDETVWNEVAKYLAIGLNNTIVHWSPDIVVLGGSVTNSIPLDKVNSYLKQFCTVFPNPPQVIRGSLGQDAGLYGALKLIQSN